MNIVVTGHLGTLGSPLVSELRRRGHTVTGIDLRHSPDGVRADVADYRQLQEAIHSVAGWNGPDLVYHLAAEFGRHNGEDHYEQVWRSNVIGTKNILRLQEEFQFRLIFASSSEVYGERDTPRLDEGLRLDPMLLSNDYAISKLVNEAQIQNAIRRDGSESMILRFFNAYGPGEYFHAYRSVVCLFTYAILKNLPYTVYRNYFRVFQYIDDLVSTLANAAERFHPGETINIGGAEYRSVEDLEATIREYVPGCTSEVTYLDTDEHNVTCKKPDISKAIALLGHNPGVSLDEGVRMTVDWMRKVYA